MINVNAVHANLDKLGKPDVLGLMRIKNESEWIRQSIESQLGICQKILVLDDHSTDDTRDIVRSFGERCVLVESPFEGVVEGRDKRFLLQHAVAVNPKWVLWIDGDEALEKNAPTIIAPELQKTEVCAYVLQVLYFWDALNKVRVDGCYRRFGRASLFRVRGQNHEALQFPSSGGEADLHGGGNCPQGLNGYTLWSGVRIKHYGYVHAEQRMRKFEFYNRIDPNNESEDCYRHIIEMPGARHAPGPTQLETFVE